MRFFLITLGIYDENNVPNDTGVIIIKSEQELTKAEVYEFCKDKFDFSFDDVFSIEELEEREAYDLYDSDIIHEI